MSWRWLVDTRGDGVKVDWARLGIVVLTALALVGLASRVLPGGWLLVIALPVAAVGIGVDIAMRKRDGDRP